MLQANEGENQIEVTFFKNPQVITLIEDKTDMFPSGQITIGDLQHRSGNVHTCNSFRSLAPGEGQPAYSTAKVQNMREYAGPMHVFGNQFTIVGNGLLACFHELSQFPTAASFVGAGKDGPQRVLFP